ALVGAALPEPLRPLEVGAAAAGLQDRLEAVPEAGVAHLPDVPGELLLAVRAVAGQDLGGEPVGEVGQAVGEAQHRLAHDLPVIRAAGAQSAGRRGPSSRHRGQPPAQRWWLMVPSRAAQGHPPAARLCGRTTGTPPDCAAAPKQNGALDPPRSSMVIYGRAPL